MIVCKREREGFSRKNAGRKQGACGWKVPQKDQVVNIF